MISKAMQEGINEQIKHEINSAYLYLSMSMYATSSNLPGFAAFLPSFQGRWGGGKV